MAQIRIDLAETLVDGMDIKFKAPCSCSEITGLVVYYPKKDGTISSKEFTFRDAHANDLTGVGNLFSKDAYVKVIADVENGYAYLQNADNNGFLNSAIFGTYTHDAENLIGRGGNGKFKATVSGTISTINVNGVSCSVKCGEDAEMDLVAGCWYTFILDGNTVNFNSGGAGGGLSFKVVGGTTEPASPKENMIWVNSDAEITATMFSAIAPSNPVEGMLWVCTDTYSPVAFNALKKNGIEVYPLYTQQYINGAWVKKTAQSYQNGAWVDWITYVIQKGKVNTAIVDGFTAYAYRPSTSGASEKKPTVSKVSGSHIKLASESSTGGAYFSEDKIDLSKYKTMKIHVAEATTEGESTYVRFGETSTKANNYAVGQVKTICSNGEVIADTVVSLDISSVNTSRYLFVSLYGSYDKSITFTDIWFE